MKQRDLLYCCGILWLAAGMPLCAADTYRVAGVVVDSENGAPLANVRVALAPTAAPAAEVVRMTSAGGGFAFDVPQGEFRILAESGGIRQVFGEQVPGTGLGSSIFTGPDQDTSKLVFRWHRPAAISGKVVDDAGDPVERAHVQVLRSIVTMGKRNVRTAAWAWTDDLGEYRVAPILAGTYYIAVTGQPWYSQAQAPKMQGSVAEAFGYAPVYYSNTADAGRAAALVVVPGQEATADFAVSPVPGVTLRVTCDGPPVTKTLRLINDGILGSESVPRTVPMPLNAATLVGVPAGRYFVDLMSTAGGSILVARQAIEIGGVDADVQLKLVPPAAVTGTVTWDSPASTPRGSLLVRLIRSNFEATFPAAVRADGSFQIPAVLAGAYEVAIYSKGNRLAAQIHSEAVASDGLLHADNGADINVRITVSDQVGGVKGLVIQDGQPAPGVFAVLMPRRERLLPGDSRAYQTDSDGSFNWQDIPAGDYFLFATRDTQLEYSNPAVLQPFLPEAKLVHVDLHGTLNERIPLADTGNTKR